MAVACSGLPKKMHLTFDATTSLERKTEFADIRHPWYALRVRARYEKSVETLLRGKGYDPLLPLYSCRRRWSDRFKQMELPLFPGYLFCRFDVQNRLPVLKTPGVILVVGIAKTPIPVDDAEIAAIQTIVRSGVQSEPWPFLHIGAKVRIEHGPLCGLEGVLSGFKGRQRLVVSVTLLRRAVAVDIDGAWVSQVHSSAVVPRPLLA